MKSPLQTYIDTLIIQRLSTETFSVDFTAFDQYDSLTADVVRHFKDKPWRWHILAKKMDVEIEWVVATKDMIPRWLIYWGELSVYFVKRHGIEVVKNHPNFPWEWSDITEYFAEHDVDVIKNDPGLSWDWGTYSACVRSWEDVVDFLDKPLDWWALSEASFVTSKIIREHPDEPWEFLQFSRREDLTLQDLTDLKDEEMDWYYLSKHSPIATKSIGEYSYPSVQELPWSTGLVCENEHVTWRMITNNPSYPWNWKRVSANPNITGDIVVGHPEFSWDFKELSRNPKVLWNHVAKIPDRNWDWKLFSTKRSFLKLVELFPNKKWHYGFLSSIVRDAGIVAKLKNKRWDYGTLSRTLKGTMTCDILRTLIDKAWDFWDLTEVLHRESDVSLMIEYPHKNWAYGMLLETDVGWDTLKRIPKKKWGRAMMSKHPSVTWEIIRDNPAYPWNFREATHNPNITFDIVLANPAYDWDWTHVQRHANITHPAFVVMSTDTTYMRDLMRNKYLTPIEIEYETDVQDTLCVRFLTPSGDKVWSFKNVPNDSDTWDVLAMHPKLTEELVERTFDMDVPWNMSTLSYVILTRFSLGIVERHLDKEWDLSLIAYKVKDDVSFIERHPDLNYNWYNLSYEMPMWFIMKHPDYRWHWSMVCSREDFLDFTEEEGVFARRWMVAYKIQKWWLESYYDPTRRVCKKRLRREFEDMDDQCNKRLRAV